MRDMVFHPVFPVYIVGPLCLLLMVLRILVMRHAGKPAGVIIKSILRLAVVLVLVFAINLRPMTPDPNVEAQLKNVDVMLVLDTTLSMWAQDYNGSHPRMDGAKNDCVYIMDRLYGANFALVRFDNHAQVLSPFTQDVKSVKDTLATVTAPEEEYATGSDLSAPYHEMDLLFTSSSRKEDRKTVVFYFSDGEITNNAELVSYEPFRAQVSGGAVLGYGTVTGGRMRTGASRTWVRDPATGADAVSYIDERNLSAIAEELGVPYIRTGQREDLDLVLDELSKIGTPRWEKTNFTAYRDLYPYLSAPLVLLLAAELLLFTAKGRL
ncbi:MAG: VWA domain-containing protein [Lachnospiraceae bacterium]|nr:VWA domain-containing protein [Lachnospiraceae bacterium]